MTASHLYPGFRHASALRSISEQRRIQNEILRSLRPRRLLSVGCAHGDEIRELLRCIDLLDERFYVSAIDVCDVEDVLWTHSFARDLGERLAWKQLDLLHAAELPGYGNFDIVQCGFVLHDVPWGMKNDAFAILLRALRRGGHLLVSEIVAKPDRSYAAEVADIYDAFIDEAAACRKAGALDANSWQAFVGDGEPPGLLHSKASALGENRDFFDTQAALIDRAESAGSQVQRIITNTVNERLIVAVLRRTNVAGHSCEEEHHVY